MAVAALAPADGSTPASACARRPRPPLGRLSGQDRTSGVLDSLHPGGETEARSRARHWLRHGLAGYDLGHDDLAAQGTSRLSPYLHFGCLSANQLAREAVGRARAEPFLPQLCWRDFHHQVLAAFPDLLRWEVVVPFAR